MKSTHKISKLNKALTRDLPLFIAMASYDKSLNVSVNKRMGFELIRNFVLFDRGTAMIYRDNEDWYDKTPKLWQLATSNPEQMKNIKSFVHDTRLVISELERTSALATFEYLDMLVKLVQQGVPGMIFAHWIPMQHEMGLAQYNPNTLSYFCEARSDIEKFFSLASDKGYQFIDTLSEQYDISSSLLKYATCMELQKLIETSHLSLDNLQKRRAERFLFSEDRIVVGENTINNYLKKEGYWIEKTAPFSKNIIHGKTACAGKITGRVQVITCREQFHEFESGSILVAPMTSPEYTPLIAIASAIVTDEGGMLSHAAIVSREQNKPCIVGTKEASYVLENFQTVEVDADQGLVKILS